MATKAQAEPGGLASMGTLLKALLLSTSQVNIYRHTKDPKKRRRIVVGLVGRACLCVMLLGYGIALCAGYGELGIIDVVPALTALLVSALALFFTIFKTNGYLFNFREYDLLMSLPFDVRGVAACKFLYMYVQSMPWYLSISIAMMIGYGWHARPSVLVYPLWAVLSLFVPIIPMLVASLVGFVVAKISSGFRKSNIIQTVLTFASVIACLSISYLAGNVFERGDALQALQQVTGVIGHVGDAYAPAAWFASAVVAGDALGALLLAGVSALLFAVVFLVVGGSYRQINSALMSHAASRSFTMAGQRQRQRSVLNALAFKEFKRLTGSSSYLANGLVGEVLAVLMGAAVLVFGFDNIVENVMHGAPGNPAVFRPAIPLAVYFFVGMLATTACSPSLEGKNYWIVQSLPLSKRTIYQGKMLFNLYLTVPCMTFAVLCLCVSTQTPLLDTVLYVALGLALCAFSTAWGCVCGIRHLRLDWENDVEVVKQGAAVTVYMLPNMLVTMVLVGAAMILGILVSHVLLALALIALVSVLAALSYHRAMTLADRT